MQQCLATKLTGERCTRASIELINPHCPHLRFCTVHWATYARNVQRAGGHHHQEGGCLHLDERHQWCGGDMTNMGFLCERHTNHVNAIVQRRQERRQHEIQRRNRINEEVQMYFNRRPLMTWREVVDDLCARTDLGRTDAYAIAIRYFRRPAVVELFVNQFWQFDMYWDWRRAGGVGDPPNLEEPPQPQAPAPIHTLAAIAQDSQNVHTRYVSQQTNQSTEILVRLRMRSNTEMRTPDWFASRWLIRAYGTWANVSRVVNDMYIWYNKRTCRRDNDYLYRFVLDGLFLRVKAVRDEDLRGELYKRTFEECFESVGMCCEGHISRLCNVLVGFDDAFAPPIPFGELLQNKMSAIAGLDVSTEEKIRQATEFFNEFAVPEVERTAWLEAF